MLNSLKATYIGKFLHSFHLTISFLLACKTVIINRSRDKYLVVGDSHSCYIAGKPVRLFLKGEDCFYALWLGPKTLHSIARSSIDIGIFHRLIKLIRYNSIIFQLGEIDVRVFLGDQQNSFHLLPNVLDDYAKMVIKFSHSVGVKNLFIMAPVPPSDFGFDNPKYPRAGSLQNRVSSHRKLNSDLQKVCNQNGVVFLDATSILSNETGSLDLEFTSDGCHVNSEGSVLVRKFILKEVDNIHF